MGGRVVKISGPGLLSGRNVSVAITRLPTAARLGMRWFEKDDNDFSWSARRSTVLSHNVSGHELCTPEHLSAACLGWPGMALALEAPDGDIPILDGSARPWCIKLSELCGPPVEKLVCYTAPLSARQEWDGGFWEVAPADSFTVDYSLDRHGYVGSVRVMLSRFADLEMVLSARTFIFEPEYQTALSQGLLPGAQEGCGLLLRGTGADHPEVLSGGPLRHPLEPVLHKILDLLGDLALLGPFLPKLHIRIHNGGHVAHQQILTRLIPYVPS